MTNTADNKNYSALLLIAPALFAIGIIAYQFVARQYERERERKKRENFCDAYEKACNDFNDFMDGKSTSTSPLGINQSFVLFDYFKYDKNEPKKLKDLKNKQSTTEMTKYSADVIKSTGSLYDPRAGYNHSFNNFFLMSLYRYDVTAYREVVSLAYGIVFLDGSSVTLYRRDTRHFKDIFKIGFALYEEGSFFSFKKYNLPEDRKSNYAEPWTWSYGVSTSKKIPPTYYGPDGYYVIQFPKNHKYLLVDIVETARLRGRLTERQNIENVQEVNCMQDIPASNITCFIWERRPHNSEREINKNAKPTSEPEKIGYHGVY